MPPAYGNECQQLMLRAGHRAHALGHEYVGTEHLLLVMLDDGSGRIAELCRRYRVDPAALWADILRILKSGGPALAGREVVPSPPACEALELAQAEAEALEADEVRAEHLLLGMLRQGACGTGVAGVVLSRHGLELDAVREAVGRW